MRKGVSDVKMQTHKQVTYSKHEKAREKKVTKNQVNTHLETPIGLSARGPFLGEFEIFSSVRVCN